MNVGFDEVLRAAIEKLAKPSSEPDQTTSEELNSWAREELQGKVQDRIARKENANRIFRLIVAWLVAVFLLLLLQGFGRYIDYVPFSDAVIITMLTTTTMNLLGLFILVTKYYFNEKRIQLVAQDSTNK